MQCLMLQYNDGYPLGPVSNIFLTSFCGDLFTLQFFTMPVFVCCRWCKSVSCSHQNIYITTSTCYFHNSFVAVCLCACQCFVFNCIQVKRSDIYIYLWRFCWEENQNNKKPVALVEMCSHPNPVSSDLNFTIFVFQEHIIYINVKSCWDTSRLVHLLLLSLSASLRRYTSSVQNCKVNGSALWLKLLQDHHFVLCTIFIKFCCFC